MSKTAVVILNFNGKNYLERFLPSVLKHSADADIIVADNASSDGSLDLLNHSFPKVQTIALKQNFGFAGGYNEALKNVD
ncbi:MAG: glycosyltransferase, partial [Ekhidna sp.]|nr:glycosyltransferase [Ekhidna sp.]